MHALWETDSTCSRSLLRPANYYLGVATIRIT